jgi:hypothetical protein
MLHRNPKPSSFLELSSKEGNLKGGGHTSREVFVSGEFSVETKYTAWIVSLQKDMLEPYTQYLRLWPYLEIGYLQIQWVKLK